MRLTAVLDPGKNVAGCAFFRDGELTDCTLIRGTDPLDVAGQAAEWFAMPGPVDELITEGQFVYPGPRKNNPNDLVPLTFCCGAVHALVIAHKRVIVMPNVWTKGTPKEIRLARAEAALPEAEKKILDAVKCPKSLRHNVVDSIALGKWYLERNLK